MKRRTLVLIALFGLLAVAILPAQAALVGAIRITGNPNCDSESINSSGPLSFQIVSPTTGTTTHSDGDVDFTLTISPTPSGRPSLAFQIAGGAAHDVILRGNTGNAVNHYDYIAGEGPGPVSEDSGLRAPTGTSLAHVWFCYEADEPEGQPIECGGEVSTHDGVPPEDEASGSFTRLFSSENCEEEKTAVVDIEEGPEGEDVIVFIPNGEGLSNYSGDLTLVKAFDDPFLLLQYDRDDDGQFRDVRACEDVTFDEETGQPLATIPNPDVETWCFYHVEGEAPQEQGDFWIVRWLVFGVGDPRFK